MPGPATVPASDILSFKLGTQLFTVAGEVTYKKQRMVRVKLDDVQSLKNQYGARLVPGMLTVGAFTTNRDMSPLNVVNGTIRVEYVSGRVITADGVTLMGEDSIDENTTTGQTNELTFGFDTSSDTNK